MNSFKTFQKTIFFLILSLLIFTLGTQAANAYRFEHFERKISKVQNSEERREAVRKKIMKIRTALKERRESMMSGDYDSLKRKARYKKMRAKLKQFRKRLKKHRKMQPEEPTIVVHSLEFWQQEFETRCPSPEELDGIHLGFNFLINDCNLANNILNFQDVFGNTHADNAVYKLAAQMLAAKLSIQLEGKLICGQAENALIVSDDWMLDILFDATELHDDDEFVIEQVTELGNILEQYNQGELCDGAKDL